MKVFKTIIHYLTSKFSKVQLIAIAALLVFAFILSDSGIGDRIKYNREISNLKSQIEYYRNKSEEDRRKLNELQSDKENIEKFARENYYMKAENEEVFIIE